jgi:hypothetical protein
MRMRILHDDGSLFGEYFITECNTHSSQSGFATTIYVEGTSLPANNMVSPTSGSVGFHKSYTPAAQIGPVEHPPEVKPPRCRRVGRIPDFTELEGEKA